MNRFISLVCAVLLTPLSSFAIVNGDVIRLDSETLTSGMRQAATTAVRLNMTWFLGTYKNWEDAQAQGGPSVTYAKREDTVEGKCSGSLINQRVVLTSAHCFFPPGLAKNARLGSVRVSFLNNAVYFGITDSIRVAPGNRTGGYDEQSNDLALIKFEAPDLLPGAMPNPYETPAVFFDGPSPKQVSVEAFGFGASTSKESSKAITQLRAGSMILNLESEKSFSADSSSASHACYADSGGPVFEMGSDGSPKLIATTRRLFGLNFFDPCKDTGYFVNLAPYHDWIVSTAAELLATKFKTIGTP